MAIAALARANALLGPLASSVPSITLFAALSVVPRIGLLGDTEHNSLRLPVFDRAQAIMLLVNILVALGYFATLISSRLELWQ